jgi:DNA-binding Lrp family transcriptional regulator
MRDPLSRKVLHALNTEARLSAKEIAQRLRVRGYRVNYAERMLRERYGLTTVPFINYGRLGVVSYLIFFSLRSGEHRRGVVEAILAHPRVGWLGELAGSFEFGCAFLATDVRQVGDFFESICNRCGEVFTNRQIVPRLTFEWFGRRYLSPSCKQGRSLKYTSRDAAVSLDAVDIAILQALGSSGVDSVKDVAELVQVPYPTAVRRVRTLENLGVIEGYFASVNPEILNREAYRILVQTGTSSRRAAHAIRAMAERDLRATFYVECLGPWEFELGYELESARELTEITGMISASLARQSVQMQVLNELRDLRWTFFPSPEVLKQP